MAGDTFSTLETVKDSLSSSKIRGRRNPLEMFLRSVRKPRKIGPTTRTERWTLAEPATIRPSETQPVVTDDHITDWRTNPRYCRGLAFLRAHAVMLQARQLLPNA